MIQLKNPESIRDFFLLVILTKSQKKNNKKLTLRQKNCNPVSILGLAQFMSNRGHLKNRINLKTLKLWH
jgi:hypothetical protein